MRRTPRRHGRQYKDYVLVLLFIKYAGMPYAPIAIPEGTGFKDMVALKGKSDIGDQINKKIIAPLANANKLSEMPDFNDANKLGTGKDMVDRLTNLIAIFAPHRPKGPLCGAFPGNKALDFSKNRAAMMNNADDILGEAWNTSCATLPREPQEQKASSTPRRKSAA